MSRSARLDLFFIAIHNVRPDIPFRALERAATPEPRRKSEKELLGAMPAWVQYLERLKKKGARDAAAAVAASKSRA